MMPTDALPEEEVSEVLVPDMVVTHSHFVTAWWLPPRSSENVEVQARDFTEVRTEIRMTHCVNEWSID